MRNIIDEAIIQVKAGDGGNGKISFRREKFIPLGGPDGGNGGAGGNIILIGDHKINTLLFFSRKKIFTALDGQNGGNNNCTGKNGNDLELKVPLGTQIYINKIIEYDICHHDQKIIVATGGRCGLGNSAFKSSTERAPKYAQRGFPGEELDIELQLKYLCDIGLVGMPNAGKSTILQTITNAKPKIDAYAFTTIYPNLGVIKHIDNNIIISDLPGLIEKSHIGKGLGHRFLRHIERCKIFIYILDATNGNPVKDYLLLKKELSQYSQQLVSRPFLICVNKIDLCDDDTLTKIRIQLQRYNLDHDMISGYSQFHLKQVFNKAIQLIS